MSKFDAAFERLPGPGSFVQSVQSSLYMRLRRTYGRSSGALGWLLIRSAQPSHADHHEALMALASRPHEELELLIDAARGTASSPAILARSEAAAFAAEIVRGLEETLAAGRAAAAVDFKAMAKTGSK
jgi:hypothetical protein